MRRLLSVTGPVLCCLALAAWAPGAAAQEDVLPEAGTGAAAARAVITGPRDVAAGRTIVLDGSLSTAEGEITGYRWFLEGQQRPISETVEAVFTPENAGTLVFRLTVTAQLPDGTEVTGTATHSVTVYSRKIVLVADASVSSDRLELHRQMAADADIFLSILQPPPSPAPIGAEEALITLLSEQSAAFVGADAIVLWTDGITGLQALTSVLQDDGRLLAGVRNQSIILLSERGLGTLGRIARGTFSALEPRQILLTRREALGPLFAAPTIDAFLVSLAERDIEVLRIDESTAGLRPWNLLSGLVNLMLTKGVPSQTVILLLVLPVIAMILAFLKQVVGITTFGLYTPSIIALSFLALGWQLGVLFLCFIVATGYLTRALMRTWRLLYIPKVAIILTVVSVTLLLLTGVSAYFDITFSRETIFILLIMSTLAESFLNLKTEQGWTSAIIGIGETILAALLCVFLVQWTVFQSLILAYPELLLLTVVVDVILGRWTGLRLVEYFRFREVFLHLKEE